MQVVTAKSAGFCFGVKRAVDMVYRLIEEGKRPIYTYGPIIHNAQVVEDLTSRGVQTVTDLAKLYALPRGTIVLRSHGVGAAEEAAIRQMGFTVADATCPFVRKIHEAVAEHGRLGEQIVIIGDEAHPEVLGTVGWCGSTDVFVIADEAQAQALSLDPSRPVFVVAQTTFVAKKFQVLVEILSRKGYDTSVLDTICSATEVRQKEARQLAAQSDAMIVIGDPVSSNTQKLFEICRCECENTYYIQTSNDMDYDRLASFNRVGITAGASTPNKIIEEVSKNVRNEL